MGSNNIQRINSNHPGFRGADFSKFSTGIYQPQAQVSPAPIKARPVNDFDIEDSFASYSPPPIRRKDGPVQRFRNMISGFKKFGIRLGEYSWAVVTGAVVGAMAGFMNCGIMHLIHKKVKNPKSLTSKFTADKSKIAVGITTFVAAITLNLFNASQNVSERTAAIDHRWNTGHRKEY